MSFPSRALVPAVGALAAWAMLAAPAQAAAPVLLSAGQESRHLTADWSLPPGVSADEVEISRSPSLAGDGSFADMLDTELVSASATSWRSSDAYSPGTYYVHVGGNDISCDTCPAEEWSNVLRVVIPRPVARTGRYSGRTESPDSRAVSFILSPTRKSVRRLKFSFRLDCSRGGFPTRELRGTVTVLRAIPVRASGSFSRVIHYPVRFRGGLRGSVTVTFKGLLRPPARATGTLRPRAALSGGERCRNFLGTVAWTASRR